MKASNSRILLIITLGLVADLNSGKRIPSYAGPYTITMRTCDNNTDEFMTTGQFWAHLFFTHPRPRKFQYTWGVYYGNTTVTDDHSVGLRRIQNQTFNVAFPAFPVMPYGRYLFTMALKDAKGEYLGVVAVDGDATPKV